jgi:hypothetical protein
MIDFDDAKADESEIASSRRDEGITLVLEVRQNLSDTLRFSQG